MPALEPVASPEVSVPVDETESETKFNPEDVEKTLEGAIHRTEQDIHNYNEMTKDKAKGLVDDLKKQDSEAKSKAASADAAKAAKEAVDASVKAAEAEETAGGKISLSAEIESDEDEESESDSESDWEDDFDPDETFAERIDALKDILTPEQRSAISSVFSATKNASVYLAHKSGQTLWYLTTTSLLLGVPLALSILSETQLTELEKEMNLQQQSGDILAPGAQQ